MKKLLFLITLILLSLSIEAQVTFIRCTGVITADWNSYKQSWDVPNEWDNCDITIMYDDNKRLITINNKFSDRFVIISEDEEGSSYDKNGVKYKYITLSVYDQDGKTPIVSFKFYSGDDPEVQVYVFYSNIMYAYSGNIIY